MEEVEVRHAKRTGEKVFGEREEPASKIMKIVEKEEEDEEVEGITAVCVGTVNPVEDFNYLLSHSVTTGASIEITGIYSTHLLFLPLHLKEL